MSCRSPQELPPECDETQLLGRPRKRAEAGSVSGHGRRMAGPFTVRESRKKGQELEHRKEPPETQVTVCTEASQVLMPSPT